MAGRRHGAFPGDEDDEALPWLEPAEPDYDDDVDTASPYRRIVYVGIAVVAFVALLWFVAIRFGGGNRGAEIAATGGEVPLIRGPQEPYKVRPEKPGGMKVDQDSMTHAVAEGEEPGSRIALDDMPEEPVPLAAPPAPKTETAQTEAAAPKPPAAAPAPTKRPAAPVEKSAAVVEKPAPAAPTPATGSVTVQLGAFSDTAVATAVWAKLAGRVASLKSLNKSVEPVTIAGGTTLYRLRAGGVASTGDAEMLCAEVRRAGEQCALVH